MPTVHMLQNRFEERGSAMNLYKIAKGYRRHLQECEDIIPGLQPAGAGWIMMAELYIASLEKREMSVSGVCVSAGVPSTTGLRYLDMLTGVGMVVRMPDENDRRRSWIRLTDAGLRAVELVLTGFAKTIDETRGDGSR